MNVQKLALFASYVYQRGRLDGSGMSDGATKEELIAKLGKEYVGTWGLR